MFKIIFALMSLFSFHAFADDGPLDRCGSLADRNLKAVRQAVEFPVEYIQWNLVDCIERVAFVNVTEGTLDQQYVGSYRLTYRPSEHALFAEQIVDVHFAAPFACEDLKLRCLQVSSSKLSATANPDRILKFGPLGCEE